MKKFGGIRTLTVIAGLIFAACGAKSATNETVVAEVGGRKIKMREVTDYIAALSVHYPTAADEFTARKRYLDRLIEERLLVIGGYARTLDADIGILEAVDLEKDKILLDELYRREVLDKVNVAEADLREAYSHWFDRATFRHVVVKEKTLADSLLNELNSGADLGDLAERHSLDQGSRYRAGDPGREFSWNELPTDMAQLVFSLEKDQPGGPLKTDMGWHVFKGGVVRKLETRDYETVKPAIEANFSRRLQQERRLAHLKQMEESANIQFNRETLGLWREMLKAVSDTSSMPHDRVLAVPASALSQAQKSLVMYTFGSEYKVGLIEWVEALEVRSPFDRPDPEGDEQLRDYAFQISLYDILREEALRQRLDESPIYKERVQEHLEKLIADRMRNMVLVRGISVNEEEVRGFYDAHPDSFINPEAYYCREIMVFKEEDAIRLAAQLRAGASFETLARLHTERSGMKEKNGDLGWVSPTSWPGFYEPASKLKPGEWTGPVAGVDQYSLIQVIEVRAAAPRPYDDVATEVFENIQRRRRDSIFTAYVDSMRAVYPVSVNEDVLQSELVNKSGVIDSVEGS